MLLQQGHCRGFFKPTIYTSLTSLGKLDLCCHQLLLIFCLSFCCKVSTFQCTSQSISKIEHFYYLSSNLHREYYQVVFFSLMWNQYMKVIKTSEKNFSTLGDFEYVGYLHSYNTDFQINVLIWSILTLKLWLMTKSFWKHWF